MRMEAERFGDTAALRTLAEARAGALCTIVGIDGSYSRRLGAQLAILPDGSMTGSLADGCLEAQLLHDVREAEAEGAPRLLRFGIDSPALDFRLPCGSGLDILVDPAPDFEAIGEAVARLDARKPAALTIPIPGMPAPFLRQYRPELRLLILGTGPECEMLVPQARMVGIEPLWLRPRGRSGGDLSLSVAPDVVLDPWTAVAILFHDHEWERVLLPWALASDAFYVGAQGGATARQKRRDILRSLGVDEDRIERLHAPIGLIPQAKDPAVLALSVMADIVARFDSAFGEVDEVVARSFG